MVVAVTILDHHVVADLEADSVPVVVARLHAAHRVAVAVLQEDASGIVAVQILVLSALPSSVRSSITTSAVYSLVSSGNRDAQVGLPDTQRFSRRPSLSLKRLPDRAISVRLMTVGPPSCGFVARSTTPSPTRNHRPAGKRDFLVVPIRIVRPMRPSRKRSS